MDSTPGPWTVETVPTSIGHAHKILPIGACLYVDNQHLPRDAVNTQSITAHANAQLMAAAPDMLNTLLAFQAAIECLEDSERTRGEGAELIDVAKYKMHSCLQRVAANG